MVKKMLFILIPILTICLVFVICHKIYDNVNMKNATYDNVLVKKYDVSGLDIIKSIKVTNDKKISDLKAYTNKIKILSSDRAIDLVLLRDIEINLNENIIISIQLSEPSYIYYENESQNISGLAEMPDGLLEWLNDILK